MRNNYEEAQQRALHEHIKQDHELLKRIWELLEHWETAAPMFYTASARSLRACFEFQEAELLPEDPIHS